MPVCPLSTSEEVPRSSSPHLMTRASLNTLVVHDDGQERVMTRRRYSMNASFLNLFMKKFTRERVPIISASVS